MVKPSYKFSNVCRVPGVSDKAVRQSTPPYDAMQLNKMMLQLVRERGVRHVFDFGPYKGIMMGQAVRGHGLVFNQEMLELCLAVSPYAYLNHLDLKRAVMEAALEFPGLWPRSKKPLDRWAAAIAERIFCLLNHLRRIKWSPVRWQQCVKNLDNEDKEMLNKMLKKVKQATREYNTMEITGESAETVDYEEDGAADGAAEHAEGGAAEQAFPGEDSDFELGAADGAAEHDEGDAADDSKVTPKKAKGKPVAKKADSTKKAAKKTGLPPKPVHLLSSGGGQKQSYIQKKTEGGKKELIVACSDKQHPEHKKVIGLIFQHLVDHSTDSKEEALKLRSFLLSK
jgi:hypothetical protein